MEWIGYDLFLMGMMGWTGSTVCVLLSGRWRAAVSRWRPSELGIGQPAVSKRIALLEREFGTQLFFRTTRKLKPTPEGHRIYDLARQILGNFDMARANVEENSLRPSGTLRISLPSSFGRRYLMPVIAEYVRTYQGVRLDVRFSERFVNLVEEGIELALRIGQLEVQHAGRAAARHGAALSGRDAGLSAGTLRCRARRKT